MANQKISTYLTEVLALIPNDRLDISKEISPGVFDTQFLKYSTLLTELNGDLTVDNLYTADDDLTGNRTVGLLANELTFASTIDANLLKLETTFGRVGIGTGTPTAKLEVVGVSSTNADFSTKFNSATKNLLSLRNDGFVHFGEAATYPSLLQGGSAFINLDNGLTPIWQVQEVNRRISWGGGGVLEMEGSATTYIQGTASGFAYAGTASNDEYRIYTNNATRIWVDVSGNVGVGVSTITQKLEVAGKAKISSQLGIGSSPAMNTYFEIDDGVANKAVKFADKGTGIGLHFKRSSDTYVGEIYPDLISADQVLVYNSRSGHRFHYNGAEIVDMNEVAGEARVRINEPTITSGALSVETKTSGGGSAFYGVNSASNTSTSDNIGVWGESKGTLGTGTTNIGGYFTASGGTADNYAIQSDGKMNMANLPTSSAGLSAGDIWNNSGVLSIV